MSRLTATTADENQGGEEPQVGDRGLWRTLTLWYAVAGGIGAWTIHLLFLSSFVRFSCNVKGTGWVHHAVTAATALMTLVAMAMAWGLLRQGSADEASGEPGGRTHFLGLLGLAIGGVNLLLILLEGSYVFFLHPCG